ncbi:MAG: DUF2330 domain-containing protein [Hadesarchaea archaeon]|nr:DUF2330 domain-containing protein [Hadesarchaea archaeon]
MFLLTLSTVSADKGMFSYISLYEPGQKAIIAWDGENEVLILATDVYASENSWALEVLPLPSEPTVTKGERGSFENASSLINSHVNSVRNQNEFKRSLVNLAMLLTVIIAGLCVSMIAIYRMKVPDWLILLLWIIGVFLGFLLLSTYVGGMYVGAPQGVEIVFHENIGAHNITVVMSDNAKELVDWAENYLDNQGIAYNLSSTKMENLTTRYIENGINYFVFDLIDLGQSWKSVDPIVYKFKSDTLYYPLEISSAASGTTQITIIAITESGLEKQQIESAGISIESARGISLEFDVGREKLERLGPEVAELFDGSARLTTLTYNGPLANLSGDLKVSVTGAPLGIEVDISHIIFLAAVVCVWAIIIGVTYHTLRSSEQ